MEFLPHFTFFHFITNTLALQKRLIKILQEKQIKFGIFNKNLLRYRLYFYPKAFYDKKYKKIIHWAPRYIF